MQENDEAIRMRENYAKQRTFDQRMTKAGFRHMLEERNAALAQVLSHRLPKPLSDCQILDFGCGWGYVSNWLREHGAKPHQITGVDIQGGKIAEAKQKFPDLTFLPIDGRRLPFEDNKFDIVVAFTVFSSILEPATAVFAANEIMRVLAKKGVVIWYDMRYPNPLNRNLTAMTLPRIKSLFPLLGIDLEPMTLLPPVAERLGSLTNKLYPSLATIPGFKSHYFGLLRDRHKTLNNYGEDTQ